MFPRFHQAEGWVLVLLVAITFAAVTTDAQEPPINAALLGSWDGYAGTYSEVCAAGQYAYVGNYNAEDTYKGQVQIIDISDPATLCLASTFYVPPPNDFSYIGDVQVADGLLFIALSSSGFDGALIVDVREPLKPALLATIRVANPPSVHTLFFADGYLYLASANNTSVVIIDLTTFDPDRPPPSPITVPKWTLTGVGASLVHDMTVHAGRLYCAAWDSGLWVYDIADIAQQPPTYLGSGDSDVLHSAWPTDDGRFVVTAGEPGSLLLWEVTEGEGSISLTVRDGLSNIGSTVSAHNPVVVGYRAYCSMYQAGLEIYDIDPVAGKLVLCSRYDSSEKEYLPEYSGCWGVFPLPDGKTVLGSDMQNGLFIVETESLLSCTLDDCNANHIFDSWDVYADSSPDCDSNGVPDECDPDCNQNGSPDTCDIAEGLLPDCNGDGLADDCILETPLTIEPDQHTNGMFGASTAADTNTALIGEPFNLVGSEAGLAYAFRDDGGRWELEQVLSASDAESGDYFGCAMALFGDVAVVAAPGDDDQGTESGAAYVFRRENDVWLEEKKLLAADGQAADSFGSAVAVFEGSILVGAWANDDDGSSSGSAYVFRYDGADWVEEAKLAAQDATDRDYFGISVALGPEVALIGAYGDDDSASSAGSAYVWRFDGTNWQEEAKLLADDGQANDYFGYFVALANDVAAIGAHGADIEGISQGAVYIFRYDGTQWLQTQKLSADDGNPDDQFGVALALSGDLLVVGANGDDDQGATAGSAYLFRPVGTSFQQRAKLIPGAESAGYGFGEAVTAWDDLIVVGAPGADDPFTDAGTASAFRDVSGDGDCNVNGRPDECDLAEETSDDLNGNGIPDECEIPTSCPGDVNGDGQVDPLDSGYLLSRFGCSVGAGDPDCDAADANADSIVDPLDVGYVLSRFGECP